MPPPRPSLKELNIMHYNDNDIKHGKQLTYHKRRKTRKHLEKLQMGQSIQEWTK